MSSGRVFKICAAAVAAFLSVPGAGHATSTMEMMEWCKPVVNASPLPDGKARVESTFESGICWGAFIALQSLSADHLHKNGINERLNQNESMLGVCPPTDSTMIQMVRIFDAYARQHPEIQHERFEFTALAALRQVYPCQVSAKSRTMTNVPMAVVPSRAEEPASAISAPSEDAGEPAGDKQAAEQAPAVAESPKTAEHPAEAEAPAPASEDTAEAKPEAEPSPAVEPAKPSMPLQPAEPAVASPVEEPSPKALNVWPTASAEAEALRKHHHRHGDLFSNWCAYNCYRVSRYARPPLGRYGYSLIPYDQDLPFLSKDHRADARRNGRPRRLEIHTEAARGRDYAPARDALYRREIQKNRQRREIWPPQQTRTEAAVGARGRAPSRAGRNGAENQAGKGKTAWKLNRN